MNLRDYQTRAVESVLSTPGNVLLVSPTGSGKTTMGVEIVRRVGAPTLWLAHRRELIVQARDRFIADGINPRVLCASVPPMRGPYADVWVGSVQTIARREIPPVEYVVIDEAHHAISPLYEPFQAFRRLGLTATPFRLDGKPLRDAGFESLIVAALPSELVAAGHMMRPRYFAPSSPILRDTSLRGGDFKLPVMFEAMATPKMVGDIVTHWLKYAANERTVVYSVNVEHSKLLVDAFSSAGIAAEQIDGSTPIPERSGVLDRLSRGETRVVTNCMVLTEGWDMPSLSVAVLARPTASRSLHLQMVGRVVRPGPDKPRPVVIDHADNVRRHGKAEDDLIYSLDSDVQHRDPVNLGMWTCLACYAMVPVGQDYCEECGADRPQSGPRSTEVADGVLVELGDEDSIKREFWDTCEMERGFRKEGWSSYRFKDRFGEWPVVVTIDGRRVYVPRSTTCKIMKARVYMDMLAFARSNGWKDGAAAHRFRGYFGHWPQRNVYAERVRS